MAAVRHSTLKVGPVTVFYREAGLEGNPVLLLLHGFAKLIALLSAPDAAACEPLSSDCSRRAFI